ncbi:MAG: hypothetical protein K5769_00195 [Pseudobutyrivibrio sp.]|nr:hypothetical protein [Pseudobutyrivibrio sp.]
MLKKKLNNLAPWLIALVGYIYDILFLLNHGRQMLDSDMASEMVLTNVMRQEHALLTTNWIYSTEIKAVGPQWFYAIGFWFSQNNWLVARTIGAGIGIFLFLASWLYLGRRLNWGRTSSWIVAFLSWPFGFWYFFDVIFGNYYIPHSIFMTLSLAWIVSLVKSDKVESNQHIKNVASSVNKKGRLKTGITYILLAVISVMSGLNGMRMLVIFYVPLFVAGLFFVYCSIREYYGESKNNDSTVESKKAGVNNQSGIKSKLGKLLPWLDLTNTKHRFALATIYALFFNMVGYAINLKFFVNHYRFVNAEGMVWGKGSGSILKTFKWYFDSFGFTDFATKEVFSFSGIGAGCGLVLGFAVLFSVVRLAMNYKKLDEESQFYVACLFGIFFILGIVFTYAWGEEQYWLQLVQFGVGALFLEIKSDSIFKDFEKNLLNYIVVAFAVISAVGTVKANITQPLRANLGFEPVVQFIEDEGYTQGVASFWRSQVVTELSNGKVEMWTMNDEFDDIFLWLQSNNHRDIPTGEFVGIYTKDECELGAPKAFEKAYNLEGEEVYGDEMYKVYLYNK